MLFSVSGGLEVLNLYSVLDEVARGGCLLRARSFGKSPSPSTPMSVKMVNPSERYKSWALACGAPAVSPIFPRGAWTPSLLEWQNSMMSFPNQTGALRLLHAGYAQRGPSVCK